MQLTIARPYSALIIFSLIVLAIGVVTIARVGATTYIYVTSLSDGAGSCSGSSCTTLRAAINYAQSSYCWDDVVITFDPSLSGVLRLNSPLPDLTCPMTVDGDNRVTISGDTDGDGDGDVERAFTIYAWDYGPKDPDILITGLTFEKFTGKAIEADPSGQLKISNVVIRDSYAGIISWAPSTGRLEVESSTIYKCKKWGMYLAPYGEVVVRETEVKESGSGLDGGGIVVLRNSGGTVTIVDSEIHDNSVFGLNVYQSSSAGGQVRVKGSRFHSNERQGVLLTGDGYPVENVWIGEAGDGNEIKENGHQGILVYGQADNVYLLSNEVYGNGYEGIKVEASGTVQNLYVGDPSSPGSGNRVYGNGDIGILLLDVRSSYVYGNVVGLDTSDSPSPNGDGPGPRGDGGIIMRGCSQITVEGNVVGYHHYQDLALLDSDDNVLRDNYVISDELSYGSIGILLTEGSSNNLVEDNVVTRHRYEGIVVLGDGSDQNQLISNKVGAFDEYGNPTGDLNDGNGAGILIANAASPDVHYPFPFYAVNDAGRGEGPDSTLVKDNVIYMNRGDGLILLNTTNFVVKNNQIKGNLLNGVYWAASTGYLDSNEIRDNGKDGVRVEPSYGSSTEPDPNDDHLSYPTDPDGLGLIGNTITGNGEYGIYVLDNPWPSLTSINSRNDVNGNALGEMAKAWLGYVVIEDPLGNPVTGLNLELLRSDGDATPDYSTTTSDSLGRYGPSGFNYDDVSTWWQIVEEEYLTSRHRYNPYRFRVNGATPFLSLYYWDGEVTSGESGGGVESPPGSGAYRYQYAKLTYRPLTPSPYEGLVVINEVLYNECGSGSSSSTNNESIELYFRADVDVSGWILTDGSEYPGNFIFVFPPGSSFRKGDYVVIWLGDPGVGDAGCPQFYVGKNSKLRNQGDDIWLLDSDYRLVDYVSYGSGPAIVDYPPGPPLWDGVQAPGGADDMRSISLTPNGIWSNSGQDWELTTSGDAPGPLTVDSDDYTCSVEAVDSLGRNNNNLIDLMVKRPDQPTTSYVYDDVYEFPVRTQVLEAWGYVDEPIYVDVLVQNEYNGRLDEEVQLSLDYSCPGWTIALYRDGRVPEPYVITLSGESQEHLLLVARSRVKGVCSVTLTLESLSDPVKGDQARVFLYAKEAGEETCYLRAQLDYKDLDGPPLELGDYVRYNATLRSSCKVKVSYENPIPRGTRLVNLTATSGDYEVLNGSISWEGQVGVEGVNVTFVVKVVNLSLGEDLVAQGRAECLSPSCASHEVLSDDPSTKSLGDPTVTKVQWAVFNVKPGEELKVRVNSTEFKGCEGWNVSLRSGYLSVTPPKKALAGEECLVSLDGSKALFRVEPVVNVRAYLKSLNRKLLITLRNLGNAALNATVRLDLRDLSVTSFYASRGEVVRLSPLIWKVDLPPWSIRKLTLSVNGKPGKYQLQGEVEVVGQGVKRDLLTDNPDTQAVGDATTIEIEGGIKEGSEVPTQDGMAKVNGEGGSVKTVEGGGLTRTEEAWRSTTSEKLTETKTPTGNLEVSGQGGNEGGKGRWGGFILLALLALMLLGAALMMRRQ